MKKDFKQELTELINKHSLEKEMRDTPDYILAQVCVDAMAVFSEASPVVTNGTDSERRTKRTQRTQKEITRRIAIFAKTVSNAPVI